MYHINPSYDQGTPAVPCSPDALHVLTHATLRRCAAGVMRAQPSPPGRVFCTGHQHRWRRVGVGMVLKGTIESMLNTFALNLSITYPNGDWAQVAADAAE